MTDSFNADSRGHDLLATVSGRLWPLVTLISVPWNVDTSGPDPFYKGPLIFPLLVLGLMILYVASGPWPGGCCSPPEPERSWRLDGAGLPRKENHGYPRLFLVAFLFGLILIGLELSSLAFLVCLTLLSRTPLNR